jgi:hypothetical protein
MGIPFRIPIIRLIMEVNLHKDSTRLNPHDYIDLETKKGNSNMYSTKTLVNSSLIAYIKPDRGTPRQWRSQEFFLRGGNDKGQGRWCD